MDLQWNPDAFPSNMKMQKISTHYISRQKDVFTGTLSLILMLANKWTVCRFWKHSFWLITILEGKNKMNFFWTSDASHRKRFNMTFYCLYSYSEGAHVQEAQYLIFRLVSWSDKDYLCDIKKKKKTWRNCKVITVRNSSPNSLHKLLLLPPVSVIRRGWKRPKM